MNVGPHNFLEISVSNSSLLLLTVQAMNNYAMAPITIIIIITMRKAMSDKGWTLHSDVMNLLAIYRRIKR